MKTDTEKRWKPSVNTVNITDFERDSFIAQQRNDAEIRAVFDHLEGVKVEIPSIYKRHLSKLKIVDGLLKFCKGGKSYVVVPSDLRGEVFERSHCQFAAGHFGVDKTERRILDCGHWWPGLRKCVEEFVGNCKVCICTKPSNRSYTHSGRRPFPSKPLDLISIDYIVELPITENDNRHILTVVDQFTKFLCVYPCKDRTAKTAAKYIYDFSLRFGIPLKLLSDQDPAYESDLFNELMKLFGVKKLRTTAYNPRSNGLTERLNGVIKNYLLAYTNFSGGEWDEWCRECAFAYNTSVNRSTGFTPNELMYGRKTRTPLHILFDENQENFESFDDFKRKLSRLYEITREIMDTTQEYSLTYKDRNAYNDVLEKDTEVYVYLTRNKKLKMTLKWDGPFKVVDVLHPVYKIQLDDEVTKYFTRDKLRRAVKFPTKKPVVHRYQLRSKDK